ncbi:hypothetical protein [Pyrobaculum sp.]|uniref:hypothetical protein n=1 Tax=Pyrobaculum sp. TaxID=2004705 RepID=UPI003D1336AD
MRKIVLTPTYDSYGDVEILSNFLVALGGVYNVYREGRNIVIELADGQSPAEVVRTVLDMGHELALPVYVFTAKKGLDDRVVVRRLEEHPLIVAAEYYPRSGRGAVVAVPGASREGVEAALRSAVDGAVVESASIQPIRKSFG